MIKLYGVMQTSYVDGHTDSTMLAKIWRNPDAAKQAIEAKVAEEVATVTGDEDDDKPAVSWSENRESASVVTIGDEFVIEMGVVWDVIEFVPGD